MRCSLLICATQIAIVATVFAATAERAYAYVSTPVGGKEGEVDASFHTVLERGTIEPNSNALSYQPAKWNQYSVGLGYTIGDVGRLKDFFIRIDGTAYTSPAEINKKSNIAPADCLGRPINATTCEFYPKDTGGFTTLALGFNAVHKPNYALGFFLAGTVPIKVNLDKFANPRVDYIAGGINLGVRFTSWLSYESRLYFGSGPFGPQNALFAFTQLLGFEASPGRFKLGVKVGPYLDGDLTERFDERYDAAYTTSTSPSRDRIRMMRFASVVNPYFVIHDRVALEFAYVQKFFGYDAPATKFFTMGVRTAFGGKKSASAPSPSPATLVEPAPPSSSEELIQTLP